MTEQTQRANPTLNRKATAPYVGPWELRHTSQGLSPQSKQLSLELRDKFTATPESSHDVDRLASMLCKNYA